MVRKIERIRLKTSYHVLKAEMMGRNYTKIIICIVRNYPSHKVKRYLLVGYLFYRKLLKSILNPLMLIVGRPNLMKI